MAQPVQYGTPMPSQPDQQQGYPQGYSQPPMGVPQYPPQQQQYPPQQPYPQYPQYPPQQPQYPQKPQQGNQPQYPPPQHQAVQPQPVYPPQQYWRQRAMNPPPKVNQWTFGMCDCLQDMGLCCDVCWCEPCVLATMHDSVEEGKNDSFNFVVLAGLCLGYCFMGRLACCLHGFYLRDRTRMLFGIRGDSCADCCVACFCLPCLECQLYRELRSQGVNPGYICCESSTPIRQPAPVPQQHAVQVAFVVK